MKLVFISFDRMEAELFSDKLKGHGVDAALVYNEKVEVRPCMASDTEIKVFVSADQYHTAASIYESAFELAC